jgi:acetylornithine deacetylase/succinyl-diaminopimelate desuccinylase-like protein
VLVFEPARPGGAVKTARKWCGEFSITVGGVTAHAGIEPGKGANAIHELAEQILPLERLQDLARGVSVNVNVVRGGTRTNVIAGEATADVDVRSISREDAARVEAAIRGLRPHRPGTSLSIAGGFERPRSSAAPRSRGYEIRQSGELGWTSRESTAADRTATSLRARRADARPRRRGDGPRSTSVVWTASRCAPRRRADGTDLRRCDRTGA